MRTRPLSPPRPPRVAHRLTDLPRKLHKTVRSAAACLRLAETLDRSQNGVIETARGARARGMLRLDLYAVATASWSVGRKQPLPCLEEALKRRSKMPPPTRRRSARTNRARARKRA
jgi:hypothetical protein